MLVRWNSLLVLPWSPKPMIRRQRRARATIPTTNRQDAGANFTTSTCLKVPRSSPQFIPRTDMHRHRTLTAMPNTTCRVFISSDYSTTNGPRQSSARQVSVSIACTTFSSLTKQLPQRIRPYGTRFDEDERLRMIVHGKALIGAPQIQLNAKRTLVC